MKYKVHYKQLLISQNSTILADGFSCINFTNIGTDTAVVNDIVPLLPTSGNNWSYNEKPYTKIETDFNIQFGNVANTTKEVLVQLSYYVKSEE